MIIIDSISITLFIFRAVCVCTIWVGAAHLECNARNFVFSVCAAHPFLKCFYFENKKIPLISFLKNEQRTQKIQEFLRRTLDVQHQHS